jgi:tetratricopeptide (TPR) repeat protein
MRRFLLVTALATALAWPPTHGLAQSFAAGYTKYQKGDFYGAEQVFRAALPGAPDATTKAKIYKFLGISQFMNGDKKGAEASFRDAVKLAPSLSVSPSEVLDESVIGLFETQKALVAPKSAPVAASPKADAPKPKADAPKPAAPALPKGTVAKPSAKIAAPKAPPLDPGPAEPPLDAATPAPATPAGGKQVLKKTLLRIQSNVADANIMMSGIIAGNANTPIEVDPGDVDIEVTAVGYVSRRVKVRIVKDQETLVTVDLEKAKRKKKAAPKKAPSPFASDGGFFGDEPPASRPGKRSGRQPTLTDEFERDQGYSMPQPYEPPPTSRQAAAPKPGNAVVAMLPFGAGQFQSQRHLLGAALAVTELGSVVFAYTEYQKSTAAAAERDALIAERNAEGTPLSAADQQFVDDSTSYVKETKQNAIYGGAAFFGLWVLGVVDALLYERDLLLHQKPPPAQPGYSGSLAPTEGGGLALTMTWTPAE